MQENGTSRSISGLRAAYKYRPKCRRIDVTLNLLIACLDKSNIQQKQIQLGPIVTEISTQLYNIKID